MSESDDRGDSRPDRRTFLTRAATAAAAGVATAWAARAAFAEDSVLDALIGDAQRGEFGQSFDEASRTIHMPKASEPTLSAATAQTTERAIDRYGDIVGRGGWPQVPPVNMLRLGDRHPSVPALRTRLVASGDIDQNAAGNDVYDSYVEGAVRRFQARHGVTVDGIVGADARRA